MQENKTVPTERLITFGLSIGANRRRIFKETSAAKYGQKRICDGICSEKTMVRIEQGGVSRNLEVYGELAERLGLKAGYYPKVEKKLEEEIDALYRAVEYCDFKEIEKWTLSALKHLEGVKDYLWYKDVYEAYKIIYDYYVVDVYIDIDTFTYCLDILHEVSDKLSEIAKVPLYRTGYYIMDDENLCQLYEKLVLEKYTGICTRINILMHCYCKNETSEILNLISSIEKDCLNTCNYERLADVYNIALSYSSCLDGKRKEYYIERLMELNDKIGIRKNAEYLCILGFSLYEVGKYELALKYLDEIVKNEQGRFPFAVVIVILCNKKLGRKQDISEVVIKTLPDDVKNIVSYFRLEEGTPDKIKQKFIMDCILPSLQKGDELSVRIIKEELMELMTKTGKYKDMLYFSIKESELLDK